MTGFCNSVEVVAVKGRGSARGINGAVCLRRHITCALITFFEGVPVPGFKVEAGFALFPFVQRPAQPIQIACAPTIITGFMPNAFVKVDQKNLTLIVNQDIARIQVAMLNQVAMKPPDNHADGFPGFV
jgi:hypothetical protein